MLYDYHYYNKLGNFIRPTCHSFIPSYEKIFDYGLHLEDHQSDQVDNQAEYPECSQCQNHLCHIFMDKLQQERSKKDQ